MFSTIGSKLSRRARRLVGGDLGTAANKAIGFFLQAANNLSDVANAATALGNLGGAPLASPALTGAPTAPTATVDTNTTQLATTAFVIGQASASGDGTPAMDGAASRGSSTHFARANHVHPTDTSLAPLASPALTGAPTAPTATGGTNTTQLATTAFVAAAIAAASAFPSGTLMLFQQTSAPTGWTKQTTHNDKALRVVSGTASSGGSAAFSSVFGSSKVTGSTSLAVSDLANGSGSLQGGGTDALAVSPNGHTHALSLDLQYVDLIIASKN